MNEQSLDTLRQVEGGTPVAEVCRELGCAESLLHKWKRQAVEMSSDSEREVIVGNITYLPLRTGNWGYLASWQDRFTKRGVGLGGRRTYD